MTPANYLEEIKNFVFHENKIVTYKWLSRRFGIHANKAKQMLFEFMFLASNESAHAVYCLCGVSEGGLHTVKLVLQEDLEEITKTFNVLTSIHIYSVESCRPKESFALATVNREISKLIPKKEKIIVNDL
ncbi:11488_t:CDS:2, partial [Acaulospora morrowiae]